MSLKKLFNESDDLTRRAFIGHAAHGMLGVGAMPMLVHLAAQGQTAAQAQAAAQAQDDVVHLLPARAKNVIYLYMSGGMTHLDTFDTKPGAETQGPTESIPTNVDGILVSQHFPNLARQMDKVAVINSMWSNQGAHAQGRYFMHTSYRLRGTIKHPSLGAWLTRMAGNENPTLPGHVIVGGGQYTASAGFFPSKYSPLPIGDPAAGLQNSKRPKYVSEENFNRRLARVAELNKAFAAKYKLEKVKAYDEMYAQAIRLMKSKDLEAFDLSKEDAAVRAAYGNDRFGQGVLLARRLVEHGVRYIEVVSGGWDTHNQNFDAMADRCPPVDRAMACLLADLEARGMLEETLVVLATEFGRTPRIVTERMGRNHYPKAFSCLLAGGGIKGGIKYGKTNETGEEIIDKKVPVQDFNATIAYALGLPVDHVIHSPSGRPFRVADKGKPVLELFA